MYAKNSLKRDTTYLKSFFDIELQFIELQLWYDDIFLRKWVFNYDNRIDYSDRQIDGCGARADGV